MVNKHAFTLVEIFVVIIILGVLAAVAVPNYMVGLSRTYARDAMDNLLAIQAAQSIYKQANASYYDTLTSSDHTADINTNLQLNITPSGGTIYYIRTGLCFAQRTGSMGAFKIALDLSLPTVSVGSNLGYCSSIDFEPNSSYNPCCINDGSKASGAVCP